MERTPVVRRIRDATAADPLCPASEALATWIDQGLGAAERASIEAHLAGCGECRSLVAQVVEIPIAARATVSFPTLGWGAWLSRRRLWWTWP